jgi:hypothetical protein
MTGLRVRKVVARSAAMAPGVESWQVMEQGHVRRDEIPVSGEMRLPQRIDPGEGILVHLQGQDQGRGVCGFEQGNAQYFSK